ncbi:inositol monophosphatase family protein [Pseudohalioglobus sediminis]|uniref:Inositol monophosphatase family protein n=1 Tax=Pseudohalioglobus sediminis TaxID=2606449 RepID=A0A5B0WRD9_9GAMM|nr:inositol monophosphatase family protein [Pseudohalioglobus sediminis]KAA1189602.1 inositol monophosphatase family protein [Pseudohalioglobus sediminis]
MPSPDHHRVIQLIREAASEDIMPLWRNLQDHQVEEKRRHDVVTEADHACEERLSRELAALLPGSLVVGEEAVHADPGVLAALDSVRPVWVIDPLDGTNNFAAGFGPFAVMVCLVQQGSTLAAWIYDPLADSMLAADSGAGAYLDGERLELQAFDGDVCDINGALSTRYLAEHLKPDAERGAAQLGITRASGCAGYDYRALATGVYQFAFYYRTLIWDHAPGVLICTEAGARAGRFDGRPYRPNSGDVGLLTAADTQTWRTARDLLVPSAGAA